MSGDAVTVWGAIVAIAALTYAIRVSFIALFGRIDTVPPRVEQALAYVPPAVLAALVLPKLVTLEPTLVETLTHDKLLAGGLAAVVAWRTESVLATIGVGMVTLWTVRFLLPLL